MAGIRHTFVFVGCLALGSQASAAITLRVASKAVLQADTMALDVRWASSTDVYVGLGKKGAVRTRADRPTDQATVMPAAERGGFFLSSRVAAGDKHLVVGSPFGGFGWIPLEQSTVAKTAHRTLATVVDLDARGDAVVVLGADTGDGEYGLAPDGAIAWTGSLSKGFADMRPLMKGRSQPGGKDMARCGFLENGGIRFMSDGSVIVAPGVEPGVYRYSAAGKLLQTWQTDSLGVHDNCDIEESERVLLGRDFPRRIEWLASRIVIDDILPLRTGPALVLRRVEKGVTKWDLVTLPYQGKSERVPLPMTLASPRGHVRGDVRGNQLVVLTFDAPLPGQKPAVAPQLYVVSIEGQ